MRFFLFLVFLALIIHLAGYSDTINWWGSQMFAISHLFKNIYYLAAIIITGLTIFAPCISRYFYSSEFDKFITDIPKVGSGSKSPPSVKARQEERRVTQFVKKYIASQQKWRCALCRELFDSNYEIDHDIPLSQGGTNELQNLQALCRNCHGKKTAEDRLRYNL